MKRQSLTQGHAEMLRQHASPQVLTQASPRTLHSVGVLKLFGISQVRHKFHVVVARSRG